MIYSNDISPLAAADVLVAGGGPAGIAAALTARRCGKSVLLVERSAQLGGMATLAGVSIWMPVGNLTGLYREIVAELKLHDNKSREFQATRVFAPLFNPFIYRQYLNHKLEAAGVEVFLHTDIVAYTDGALVVNTLEGLRAVTGRVIVDATGDARVARDAGVPCRHGRPADGLTQPMTLMFQMQDTGRPVTPVEMPDCPRYASVADLPQARLLHWEDKTTGTLLVNMTRVRGFGASTRERGDAEREGLRQVFGVAAFLQRTSHPTYVLSHIGGEIGVRETWQIEGVYTLTEDDIRRRCRFDDVVAQTNYMIDIHNPNGAGGCDIQKVDTYDIPYRSLVPASGPANLIVAGRALSATHAAMSSVRVQPTCMALGQAAGCAAALAIDQDLAMRDVPTTALRQGLQSQGVEFA